MPENMTAKPRQIGLTLDGDTIILHKFKGKFEVPGYATSEWRAKNQASLKRAAGLDLETTGLDFQAHKIVEIAVRPFTYRVDTGEVIEVEAGYTALQDPGEPLSPEVARITGLCDDLLKGQAIDWAQVERVLESVELIVAHNAGFDRPFMDRALPASREMLWGCSLKQVDWSAKGFDIQKLGILAHQHGFFVDAHRAMNDVNGMLYLLSLPDETSGRPYFLELATNAARGSVLICADGSPFETKDLLRSKGYRWDPERRSWCRAVYRDEFEAEREWLTKNVYRGNFAGFTREIPLKEQFANPRA